MPAGPQHAGHGRQLLDELLDLDDVVHDVVRFWSSWTTSCSRAGPRAYLEAGGHGSGREPGEVTWPRWRSGPERGEASSFDTNVTDRTTGARDVRGEGHGLDREGALRARTSWRSADLDLLLHVLHPAASPADQPEPARRRSIRSIVAVAASVIRRCGAAPAGRG